MSNPNDPIIAPTAPNTIDDLQRRVRRLEEASAVVSPDSTAALIAAAIAKVNAVAWHLVGAAGEPALSAGWSWYGAPFGRPRFALTHDNAVLVSGLVAKSTAPTPGEVIFTLPTGYRPDANRIFVCPCSSSGAEGSCRVDVTPAGNVQFVAPLAGTTPPAGSYVSLELRIPLT